MRLLTGKRYAEAERAKRRRALRVAGEPVRTRATTFARCFQKRSCAHSRIRASWVAVGAPRTEAQGEPCHTARTVRTPPQRAHPFSFSKGTREFCRRCGPNCTAVRRKLRNAPWRSFRSDRRDGVNAQTTGMFATVTPEPAGEPHAASVSRLSTDGLCQRARVK